MQLITDDTCNVPPISRIFSEKQARQLCRLASSFMVQFTFALKSKQTKVTTEVKDLLVFVSLQKKSISYPFIKCSRIQEPVVGVFNPLIEKHNVSVVRTGLLQSVSLVGILEGLYDTLFSMDTIGLDLNSTQNTTNTLRIEHAHIT